MYRSVCDGSWFSLVALQLLQRRSVEADCARKLHLKVEARHASGRFLVKSAATRRSGRKLTLRKMPSVMVGDAV
jgi:hypothetical protein